MSSFRKGQRLICIDPRGWMTCLNTVVRGPAINEIVTFDGYDEDPSFILLVEYPGVAINGMRWAFEGAGFRPLIEQSATAQLARLETERWVEGETVKEPEPAY